MDKVADGVQTIDINDRKKEVTMEPMQDEIHAKQKETDNGAIAKEESNIYSKLLEMEQWALVPNTEDFHCEVCMELCKAFSGVVLRECLHSFCQECLVATIQHSAEPIIMCPHKDCSGTLLESEIKTLISPEEYKHWLDRGLSVAEKSSMQTFHCCMRDCIGWAYCEPNVQNFPCPVCGRISCVPCKAIHEGESCADHQLRQLNETDQGSQVLLGNLMACGEALPCPECNVIIMKSSGCDWILCTACKTEICWVTRGRRWGPSGRGDTSGGCRCRYNRGPRCHPSCGNCH